MKNSSETAQEIVESFNTWKFKREQPHTYEGLIGAVEKSVEGNAPIHFIAYWGVGDRNETMEPEQQTLSFMNKFFQRIRDVYSSEIKFTLIFTDTHGSLNGYPQDHIQNYFSNIQKLIENEGHESVFLSDIVPFDRQLLENSIEGISIDPVLHKSLIESGRKHFKGTDDLDRGVKMYYVQNQFEKRALAKTFSGSIFLTFNGSEMNDLFPLELPIFYMYSLHSKTSVKPWFE